MKNKCCKCDLLAPFITGSDPSIWPVDTPVEVTIFGGHFDKRTELISVTGATIERGFEAISGTSGSIKITPDGSAPFVSIELDNCGCSSATFGDDGGQNMIEVVTAAPWVDWRLGGDPLDIVARNGTSVIRHADGAYYTGASPWRSWYYNRAQQFTNSQNATIEMIFKNLSNTSMVGIASDQMNGNSTTQYYQFELVAYFSTVSYFGLFGNSGTPGAGANNGVPSPTNFPLNSTLKIKFQNSGNQGSTFELYLLPSDQPADWDDESNLLASQTVSPPLAPAQVNRFPGAIPVPGSPTTGTQMIATRVTI